MIYWEVFATIVVNLVPVVYKLSLEINSMRILLSLFLVFVLTACSSTSNKSLDNSVFFEEVFPLTLSSPAGDEYHYLAPRLDFKRYKQIYIAPVRVFDDEEGVQVNRLVTDQIMENLRFRLQQLIEQKGLETVYEPVAGGLEMHAAITSIRLEGDGMGIFDLLWPSFENEMDIDSPENMGRRHIELRGEVFLRDTYAETTVAQFVSVKQGVSSAGDDSEVDYSEVRPVMEQWAERAVVWVSSLLK